MFHILLNFLHFLVLLEILGKLLLKESFLLELFDGSFHIKLCLGSGGGCLGHLTEQRVLLPGPGPGAGGSDGMG